MKSFPTVPDGTAIPEERVAGQKSLRRQRGKVSGEIEKGMRTNLRDSVLIDAGDVWNKGGEKRSCKKRLPPRAKGVHAQYYLTGRTRENGEKGHQIQRKTQPKGLREKVFYHVHGQPKAQGKGGDLTRNRQSRGNQKSDLTTINPRDR